MTTPGHQAALETIAQLADDIARTSPESADKAMRIVRLLGELDSPQADRGTIQDAIEAEVDTDLTDTKLRSTAEAVARSIRET